MKIMSHLADIFLKLIMKIQVRKNGFIEQESFTYVNDSISVNAFFSQFHNQHIYTFLRILLIDLIKLMVDCFVHKYGF